MIHPCRLREPLLEAGLRYSLRHIYPVAYPDFYDFSGVAVVLFDPVYKLFEQNSGWIPGSLGPARLHSSLVSIGLTRLPHLFKNQLLFDRRHEQFRLDDLVGVDAHAYGAFSD